jgi:predicted DNA-binding transcriptional regulator
MIKLEEKISKIKKVLKRDDLGMCEKVIFIYLVSFSENNIIRISRYEILKDLGISNLTLGKHLNCLSDKKLVYRKQIRTNGRFTANEYSFLEERKD